VYLLNTTSHGRITSVFRDKCALAKSSTEGSDASGTDPWSPEDGASGSGNERSARAGVLLLFLQYLPPTWPSQQTATKAGAGGAARLVRE
jgi:hypothetical protein